MIHLDEELPYKSKKYSVKEIFLKFSGYIVPILQYVPATGIWFGIMSIPLIGYFIFLFSFPTMIWNDFLFLITSPELIIALVGLVIFIYSLIFIIKNRKQGLVISGPYKYLRHPQYFGIIIMTLALTILCLRTSPITPIDGGISSYIFLVTIWVVEVLLYIGLAKIEDLSLKKRFKEDYISYSLRVPFMVPFIKFNRK